MLSNVQNEKETVMWWAIEKKPLQVARSKGKRNKQRKKEFVVKIILAKSKTNVEERERERGNPI